VDDKRASNAKLNDDSTWREHVTSSMRFPVLKSGRSRNRFAISGRRPKRLLIDKATKAERTANEPAVNNVLMSDSRIIEPETQIIDSGAVENGSSNEISNRLADDEDDSSENCDEDIDTDDNIGVNVEPPNYFQTSGNLFCTVFVFYEISHRWCRNSVCSMSTSCPCFALQPLTCLINIYLQKLAINAFWLQQSHN